MTSEKYSSHVTTVRVRYAETDAMGYLHHANYITFFELARTELFRAQAGSYRLMEERGYFLVVVKVECHYKRPAFFDDELHIKAELTRRSGAKLVHDYEIRRDGELIATGQTVLACLDREGNIQRITDEILFGT